jgi:hypothetical protein
MTERNDLDFERALRRSLHDAALAADPRLADRLLSRTAAEPQRQRRSFFSTFAPALAAAAVVAVAAIVGLSLGQLPRVGTDASPSPSPAVTAEPSATPSPSESERATPSASPTLTPSASSEGQRCTNEQLGFALLYPDDWHTNEEIEQMFDDPPTSPCTFFGPEPMDIAPNAGLPPTVAITFGRQEGPSPHPGSARLVMEDDLIVDGHQATVREWEWTEDDVFHSRGERFSSYEVELGDGTFLIASTNHSAEGEPEERKEVLDAMMQSLEFLSE